jgi:transketolase C-terminal domain/subunit
LLLLHDFNETRPFAEKFSNELLMVALTTEYEMVAAGIASTGKIAFALLCDA